jgi:hypothetical protein
VRGFTIISVGGTSPTTLVYVTNAENFFIGYNIFNGPADVDLQVRYSSYGNVVFNNFVRADNTNAYAIGSSFVHYSNNVFGQGAVIGFEFDLGGTQFGNFLANNYFAGNNGQSIIVLGLQGSLISQNQIANAIGCGIGLFATGNSINNIRVTSNSINGGSQGFCFYGIEDTTFDGNVVTNSQLAAFQDLGGGSGYLNIASNFIRNAGIDSVAPLPAELAAIYVSNSPYSSVNVINNVYQGGAFKLNFYVDSHFVGATVSGDTASIALPNLI